MGGMGMGMVEGRWEMGWDGRYKDVKMFGGKEEDSSCDLLRYLKLFVQKPLNKLFSHSIHIPSSRLSKLNPSQTSTMSSSDSVFTYTPSFALALVATILYLIPTLILTWQTIFKYRSWFFLCVLLGAAIEVAGYTCRTVATKHVTSIVRPPFHLHIQVYLHPTNLYPFLNSQSNLNSTQTELTPQPPYALSATLIILAPIFIAAGNYLLLGRLIRTTLPTPHHRLLRVPAHRITRLFVCCDILTFLVQASGSGIAGDWTGSKAKTGANVIIGGLGLQVATFSWFLCVLGRFWQVVRREGDGGKEGWRKVFGAVCVSSVLILVSLLSLSMGLKWWYRKMLMMV